MQFGSPIYGWLLLLLPIVFMIYLFGWKAKNRALQSFASRKLLDHLLRDVSTKKPKIKMCIKIGAFPLSIIELMQPKRGYHWEELKRKGLDILIAVDVSKSMLTEDIKPNRLEVAKREIKSLINKLHGDRVGIVSFAGSSFLQCPLTLDYGTAKMFVDT
ncbi:MAG: VWA domain-containing protein, partial [Chlamydiota bacterium]|nr:VWA domain-containing protein [Chlamydiota bacterium]